jgi:hypothetical protein
LGPSQANDNNKIPGWALTNGGRRLLVDGTRTLKLAPGTYYFPDGIRIAGSARVVITGPTKFLLNGSVEVAGNGIANQTVVPANLRIEMVSTSATFAGSASLYADIYAPTTQVNVNGEAGFYGAIFAETIAMEGNGARLHGDESLHRKFDEYTMRSSLKQ